MKKIEWKEIEKGKRYFNVVVREGDDTAVYHEATGGTLRAIGYTHYIPAKELLSLPIAQLK